MRKVVYVVMTGYASETKEDGGVIDHIFTREIDAKMRAVLLEVEYDPNVIRVWVETHDVITE